MPVRLLCPHLAAALASIHPTPRKFQTWSRWTSVEHLYCARQVTCVFPHNSVKEDFPICETRRLRLREGKGLTGHAGLQLPYFSPAFPSIPASWFQWHLDHLPTKNGLEPDAGRRSPSPRVTLSLPCRGGATAECSSLGFRLAGPPRPTPVC